ncbi:hypothetical protein PSEUDO8O_20281 [Pseudomonas sp. 8O]|nr:hypothetical protein PSEUDO8O_20281 [Pseudomonas sp. 8O]
MKSTPCCARIVPSMAPGTSRPCAPCRSCRKKTEQGLIQANGRTGKQIATVNANSDQEGTVCDGLSVDPRSCSACLHALLERRVHCSGRNAAYWCRG